MGIKLPVRVGLMDDDYFALKWNADILSRDLRTNVCLEAESPTALLNGLRDFGALDILLVDVEYSHREPALPALIRAVLLDCPNAVILCLSQYGGVEQLIAAIACGARGFLLKREIRMGIGSAIAYAFQVDFLITTGILPLLQQVSMRHYRHAASIAPWVPHPGLTPKLRQVFTLRVLYGMSAPMAAHEVHLSPATVEKYMQYAYQRLSVAWGDERYLVGLDLSGLPQEVQAFHLFNLPPKG